MHKSAEEEVFIDERAPRQHLEVHNVAFPSFKRKDKKNLSKGFKGWAKG